MTFGYPVILADPPWPFGTWSAKGRDRSPDAGVDDDGEGTARHYRTLSLEELAAIPVGDWAAQDAALFLWVPDFQVHNACDLARAWGGFGFRTVGFYWVKVFPGTEVHKDVVVRQGPLFPIGLGTWTRSNPEQCWIFGRGRGVPVVAHDVPKLVIAQRGVHSAKPPEVHRRIERLVGPELPKLELFARVRRSGWVAWGDQVAEEEAVTEASAEVATS